MPHKSTSSRSFGDVVAHWRVLAAGLEVNAGDLPHLDGHRILLQSIVAQSFEALSEQRIQAAAKQDLSRRVQILLDQGSKLASFLRSGVKQHYGTRSEKLVEFDLLPFRGKEPAKSDPPKLPVPEVTHEKEAASGDE
jgi:hypothetical protein